MIVPTTPGPVSKKTGQPIVPPKPTFALMAAAQMHGEGRLIKPGTEPNGTQPNQAPASLTS